MSDELKKIYSKYFDDSGEMKPKGKAIMGEGLKGLSGPKTITEKGAFLPKAKDVVTKAAKASKYGKIATGVVGAGLAIKAFLKSKMDKEDKPESKMGGGMMNKYSTGKAVKGYGKARTSGMGLQDENITLGKGSDYIKDLL